MPPSPPSPVPAVAVLLMVVVSSLLNVFSGLALAPAALTMIRAATAAPPRSCLVIVCYLRKELVLNRVSRCGGRGSRRPCGRGERKSLLAATVVPHMRDRVGEDGDSRRDQMSLRLVDARWSMVSRCDAVTAAAGVVPATCFRPCESATARSGSAGRDPTAKRFPSC